VIITEREFKLGKDQRKKFNVKLKEMNDWLKSVRNTVGINEWWKVLVAKIRGHYEYYGISGNYASLGRSINRPVNWHTSG
jgi:hypothetical protein